MRGFYCRRAAVGALNGSMDIGPGIMLVRLPSRLFGRFFALAAHAERCSQPGSRA